MPSIDDVLRGLAEPGQAVIDIEHESLDEWQLSLLEEALRVAGHTPGECHVEAGDGTVAGDGFRGRLQIAGALRSFKRSKHLADDAVLDTTTRQWLFAAVAPDAAPYLAIQDELDEYRSGVNERETELSHREAVGTLTAEEERAADFLHQYWLYRQGRSGNWTEQQLQWFRWADQDPDMNQLYGSYGRARATRPDQPQASTPPDPDEMLDHPPDWYVKQQYAALKNGPLAGIAMTLARRFGANEDQVTAAMQAADTVWSVATAHGEAMQKGQEATDRARGD
ncbi:MAG: hypothetical protein ACRD29_09955 [Acidimicrobiales bacterium]